MTEDVKSSKVRNRRVHMANERTFLAWIRTGIGIMAFGFVVEKFALFVKQMAIILGREPALSAILGREAALKEALQAGRGYSSALGVFLVALGALMGLLAFIRYKKVERQIDEDTYQPSKVLGAMLAMSVLAVGVFLIAYLLRGI